MEFEQAVFSGRDVCISTITYYEQKRKILLLGSSDKMKKFEDVIRSIKLIDFTQQTADIASKIYAELKISGKPISACDYLIGATALEKGLPIVAEDGHFGHINGIKHEIWRKD